MSSHHYNYVLTRLRNKSMKNHWHYLSL